jgi:hypothetical protein
MKEERLICRTTTKLSLATRRCLQIYTAPRNGAYILLCAVKISPVSLILFRPGTILSSYRLMSIPTAF